MHALGHSQEDTTERESSVPPVTSLLDRDILNLFTPSESGSQEDLKEGAVGSVPAAADNDPLAEVSHKTWYKTKLFQGVTCVFICLKTTHTYTHTHTHTHTGYNSTLPISHEHTGVFHR